MSDATLPNQFLVRLQRNAQHRLGLLNGAGKPVAPADPVPLGGSQCELIPLFQNHRMGLSLSFGALAEWYIAKPTSPLNTTSSAEMWQIAHDMMSDRLGATPSDDIFVEPDFVQKWEYENPTPMLIEGRTAAAGIDLCQFNDQNPDLPKGPGFAWFLLDDFTGLQSARDKVATSLTQRPARIAHLDTGYDVTHKTLPAHLLMELQRNFVEGEPIDNAKDPAKRGFLKNPGHGTGTLSILAGNTIPQLNDCLGGAPGAEIIPVRIASSVVLIRTSALARALDYVLAPLGKSEFRPDVVSLSMGGVASAAWADAVNRCYESGICIVAAAGNNYADLPTRFIVFPARFRRVIAACGVMANDSAYHGLPPSLMQGNYGPKSKMETALSGFTPNMPWAELGCPGIVDQDGQGTSSATPQIAAAAALWLQLHNPMYDEPWKRVEAVRRALFTSADKRRHSNEADLSLGQGILKARRALDVQPSYDLAKTPRDSASFAFLRVLTGLGLTETDRSRAAMLALEATQLCHRHSSIENSIADPDVPPDKLSQKEIDKYVESVVDSELASPLLVEHFKSQARSGTSRVWVSPRPETKEPMTAEEKPVRPALKPERVSRYPAPPTRRLRGFAFDPSLSLHLDTAVINETWFELPWEPLTPGPVGEYLEVIDFDPATKCFYEPVDLDDPHLLAQGGLAPTDGDPRFHQQMAYAVAMLTIKNFERALGRKSLWAHGPGEYEKDDSHFVQRLRIYPHALREANAYYSPDKLSLLLGYFPASEQSEEHLPGGTVFTCLSLDIIAHETTHALLDGMHWGFRKPTNPDALAFHEAFADIVALFQHFTFPEIVYHEVAKVRGDLRAENMLGQLAWEFGRAMGSHGSLRSAIGHPNPTTHEWEREKADPTKYQDTTEPHERGAILVAAVFDAFVSIFQSRVADLLRIATGGSGILPSGAISPDLGRRLSAEASKAAQHVLTICIRALDYCPPVDLTFGEYLRALVTADQDLVPSDDHSYRIAFVEAFRARGLFPTGIRTMSLQSLVWRAPEQSRPYKPLQLASVLGRFQNFYKDNLYVNSRENLFFMARNARSDLHLALQEHFCTPVGRQDAVALHLRAPSEGHSFEVRSLRVAERIGPDGSRLPQMIIEIIQRDHKTDFEGGCTLIVNALDLTVRYCIYKNIDSADRQRRQEAYQNSMGFGELAETYFQSYRRQYPSEPFALMHRRMARGGSYA